MDTMSSCDMDELLSKAIMECSRNDPEKMNLAELKEYYSLKGRLGSFRLNVRLVGSYLLQKLADDPIHPNITVVFQRMRGVQIGAHTYIGPHVHIDFLYPHLVQIGDYVSIGMYCMIFAHSNPTCSVWLKTNKYPRSVAPVIIKDGAWIPPGTIILPGVTIGEHSVVAAGSIVTKDVEPFTMVGGRPAKLIKRLL